jgi:hypothetical protein
VNEMVACRLRAVRNGCRSIVEFEPATGPALEDYPVCSMLEG